MRLQAPFLPLALLALCCGRLGAEGSNAVSGLPVRRILAPLQFARLSLRGGADEASNGEDGAHFKEPNADKPMQDADGAASRLGPAGEAQASWLAIPRGLASQHRNKDMCTPKGESMLH